MEGGIMRESQVERAVVAFAKANGIGTLKNSGIHDAGKPDRVFFKDGKVLFLELKAPGKKPTALQMKAITDIHATGTAATWADNAPLAILHLREHFGV